MDKSATGIMTGMWSGQRANRNSISGRCKIFCCFLKCPDRPQGPLLFYSMAPGGILSVSRATYPRGLAFTPYNVEIRMSGNSNSTPSYASMSCTWTLCLYLYSLHPDKYLDRCVHCRFRHVLLNALLVITTSCGSISIQLLKMSRNVEQ